MVVEDRHKTRNVRAVLGLRGARSLAAGDDPLSKSLVHLLESTPGIAVEASSEEREEDPAEPFALNELRPSRSYGLEFEDVLPVEESGESEAAEPPKFTVRDDRDDLRAKLHSARARRSEGHLEAGPLDRGAAHAPDERILPTTRFKVRQTRQD